VVAAVIRARVVYVELELSWAQRSGRGNIGAMNLNIALGLLGLALLTQADPKGTSLMSLSVGETKTAPAPPAAQVVCDDPAVVQGIPAEGKARFTGLKVGSTLCGVRAVSGETHAAYRITVTPKN